mmetsp:Transcript_19683/g.56380  ORF Transcript_19683/g.56380 Transcript_19683/m.56380 type:complete len:86 (+) Transcript_19683:780-1037(+)
MYTSIVWGYHIHTGAAISFLFAGFLKCFVDIIIFLVCNMTSGIHDEWLSRPIKVRQKIKETQEPSTNCGWWLYKDGTARESLRHQ